MTDRDTANQNDAMESLRVAPETLRHLQKLEVIEQLSGGVAHDLNNSFQSVVAALELVRTLIAAGRSGESERFIASAISAARNAAALNQRVNGLLRRKPPDPKPLAINELILGMEDMLRRALSRSIKLELALSSDSWQTHCDESQAEGALLNLVLNARDAMPEGGTMTIQTRNLAGTISGGPPPAALPPGDYVCITVTDSGTGMSDEVIEHAAEAFFTTKAKGRGAGLRLGLGLTMVDDFTRRNGGAVRIQSAIGHGSSVAIYLPRHASGPPT